MKNWRKIVTLTAIIIAVLYLFSCGCSKLAEKAAQEATKKAMEEAQKEIEKEMEKNKPTTPTTQTTTDTTKVSTGKMTDDVFVELTAYDQYLSWQLEQGKIKPADFKPLRDKKYQSFGVTDKDYMNFVSKTASENPQHYASLMEKVDSRVKELKKK